MARPKKKKGGDAPAGAPLWMCTFSDMMSLLLCFFVLLFAMSTIDKRKFEQAIGSVQGAMGRIPNVFSESWVPPIEKTPQKKVKPLDEKILERAKDAIAKEERQRLVAEKMERELRIVGVPEGIRFHIEDRFLFAPASAVISASGEKYLDYVGSRLLDYPLNKVRIEGHTDNTPISTEEFKDNWELSEKRALVVMRYLHDYFLKEELEEAIPREEAERRAHTRLTFEANGQYQPIEPNDTPEGRAQNRRVDILLLESDRSEYVEGYGPDVDEDPARPVPTSMVEPDLRTVR